MELHMAQLSARLQAGLPESTTQFHLTTAVGHLPEAVGHLPAATFAQTSEVVLRAHVWPLPVTLSGNLPDRVMADAFNKSRITGAQVEPPASVLHIQMLATLA